MKFRKFNKISRLSRECVISEKIDGTNGQIYITNFYEDEYIADIELDKNNNVINIIFTNEVIIFIQDFCILQKNNLYMFVGSRKRWIKPKDDNCGFAKWVYEKKEELMKLGVGLHFGEWWGQGIQRNYGLKEKRFSLFNVHRWSDDKVRPQCCSVVPILYTGMFNTEIIEKVLSDLKEHGSYASPGFDKPEGIVVFHKAGRFLFKKTVENDEVPKSLKNNS